jgi:hypothetical protein
MSGTRIFTFLVVIAGGAAMTWCVVPLGRGIAEADDVIERAREALEEHQRTIIIRFDVLDDQETWLMSLEMGYRARRDELVRRWWSCAICGPALVLLGVAGLFRGLFLALSGSRKRRRRRIRKRRPGERPSPDRPPIKTRGGRSRRP